MRTAEALLGKPVSGTREGAKSSEFLILSLIWRYFLGWTFFEPREADWMLASVVF